MSLLVVYVIFAAYSVEICSGQDVELVANFTDVNNNIACKDGALAFTCTGYGSNILFVSPPLIPMDIPVVFVVNDNVGRELSRGSNSEAVSVLEQVTRDGSGNATFVVRSTLPITSVGMASAQCTVQQGLIPQSRDLTYEVRDVLQPPQDLIFYQQNSTLSWTGQEEAISYEILVTSLSFPITSMNTTNNTEVVLNLPSGDDYSVQVFTNSVCGLSEVSMINISIPESESDSKVDESGLCTGAIIGICIAVLILICGIVFGIAIICYFMKFKTIRSSKDGKLFLVTVQEEKSSASKKSWFKSGKVQDKETYNLGSGISATKSGTRIELKIDKQELLKHTNSQ